MGLQSLNESPEMPIKAASYTRLSTFESCKFRAKLAYIDKIPEPERPLPPGKTEHANVRGSRLHDAAELYVKGGTELIPELMKFETEFKKLRELHKAGSVSTEGEWSFRKDWTPVPWMSADVWIRVKLDAIVFLSAEHAVVIDYKSGKRYGNEIKHGEQCQLYQLASFIRYPKIQKITTELFYLDLDELVSQTYTRSQGLRFLKGFEDRIEKLTTEEDFPPNPSQYGCRWCAYGPKGTGHCSVGIQQ